MSRSGFTIEGALKSIWGTRAGTMRKADARNIDGAIGNDIAVKQQAPAGTSITDHEMFTVDADNDVRFDGTVKRQSLTPIPLKILTNATQHFFIAPYKMRIRAIQEIHSTAEATASTLTAYIAKCKNGIAAAGGTSVMSGTFNLKGTANTLQTATLSGNKGYIDLEENDRLAIVISAAATELAGLTVYVWAEPGHKKGLAVFHVHANAALADQAFFVANRPGIISAIKYAHATAGTNGSAVNVQVTKDTGTNAPGAGLDILTNNSDAGFDCKGAIDTVQAGTLTATAATLRFAAGDRLAADFAGTLTALVGVVIVVAYTSFDDAIDVTYNVNANASLADRTMMIANRSYLVRAFREVHATAGNDGGAVNLQVTADKATDAPGAGVDLLTNNTNAGFDLKGTANTVQTGTLVDEGSRILLAGDRLSVDFAGTLTTLAGVVVTATIEAI